MPAKCVRGSCYDMVVQPWVEDWLWGARAEDKRALIQRLLTNQVLYSLCAIHEHEGCHRLLGNR